MRTFWNGFYIVYGRVGQFFAFFENQLPFVKATRRKPQIPGHVLYHFHISWFSTPTRYAIYRMKVNVPFVDVLIDHDAFRDLVKKGGKDQVPCLRIESTDGVRWMYESKDIIAYLKRFK